MKSEELHQSLNNVEDEIKKIVGIDINNFIRKHAKYDDVYETVKDLLHIRQCLLDKLFLGTPDELARFEEVNSLLDKLTKKMYCRTATLYRTLLTSCRDEDFDHDYMACGSLKCVVDYDFEEGSYHTILHLDNDEFYDSDFGYMLSLVNGMQDINSIVECKICYEETHTSVMSDEELNCYDYWDDSVSWNEGRLNRKELAEISICYATHAICVNNNYSIPDLLRLNSFWVEAQIICQHIVDQDGKCGI